MKPEDVLKHINDALEIAVKQSEGREGQENFTVTICVCYHRGLVVNVILPVFKDGKPWKAEMHGYGSSCIAARALLGGTQPIFGLIDLEGVAAAGIVQQSPDPPPPV